MDFFEVCKEATTRYGPAAPHEEQISMFLSNEAPFDPEGSGYDDASFKKYGLKRMLSEDGTADTAMMSKLLAASTGFDVSE